MKNNEVIKLQNKYKWLTITTTIENYVEPIYYNNLLKPYVFNGKSDEDIFKEFILKISNKNINILELGSGTGRVTQVLFKNLPNEYSKLTLVDLSQRMINYIQKKFIKKKNLAFVQSDSIKFLESTNETYDFIFSLWSFSHSIHQILIDLGEKQGKLYIKSILKKMVLTNMKKNSTFFLIHFDSKSDEQKILMQQWKKVYPVYKNSNKQSPSKLLLDEVFNELADDGFIEIDIKYYEGSPITYSNMDEALEIFLNFHLESYFNKNENLLDIIEEFINYFKKFMIHDGKIEIKPGSFIYKIKKK